MTELTAEQRVWALELVTAVTYPQWEIGIQFLPGGLVIHGTHHTQDVNGEVPNAAVLVSREVTTEWLTDGRDRHHFETTLAARWCIQAQLAAQILCLIEDEESHERLEGLRIGGRPVYDPHPYGGSTTVPNLANPDLSGITEATRDGIVGETIRDDYSVIPYLVPWPVPVRVRET